MVMRHGTRALQAGLLAGSLLVASGCKQSSPPSNNETPATSPSSMATAPAQRTDQDLANDIQSRINAESALNGQNIQVSVNNGMATLNGSVNNDAARALAAADSGGVNGIRTVVNNLTVAPQRATREPAPAPVERKRRDREREETPKQTASAPPPAGAGK